jgi:hypothetical protein
MRHRWLPLATALLALGLGGPARALTTISTDVTLPGAPYGDAIHDEVKLTGSAVLTINTGGWIDGPLEADDSRTVNLSGGKINGPMETHNSSTLNVSSGQVVTSETAYESSTVNGAR